MVTVKAIKCSKCQDLIYSRARHDCHKCTCGSLSVDGGFEILRILSLTETSTFAGIVDLPIDATKEQLYNDWNEGKNEYGWWRSCE